MVSWVLSRSGSGAFRNNTFSNEKFLVVRKGLVHDIRHDEW